MSIFKLLPDDSLLNSQKWEEIFFNRAILRPADDLLEIFESYVDCLDRLNSSKLIEFCLDAEFCSDFMDFYHLRVCMVLKGQDFFNAIISGNFENVSIAASFLGLVNRYDDGIRRSLIAAYIANSGRILLNDATFYTTKKFISSVGVNHFSSPKFSGRMSVAALAMGGEVLPEVSVENLGVIRQGDFLVHKKLGICCIYIIAKNNAGQITSMVLFKDGMHNMLLSNNDLWRRLDS